MQQVHDLDRALAAVRQRVQDEREQVLEVRRHSREVSAWARQRRDSVRAAVAAGRGRPGGPDVVGGRRDLFAARAVMTEAFEEARAVGYRPGSPQMLWLQRAESLLKRAQERYRPRS